MERLGVPRTNSSLRPLLSRWSNMTNCSRLALTTGRCLVDNLAAAPPAPIVFTIKMGAQPMTRRSLGRGEEKIDPLKRFLVCC